MDTTHRKIRQTQTTPLGDDLPRGVSISDLKELDRRCDQWLAWKAGRTPEPEWHKGKGKR